MHAKPYPETKRRILIERSVEEIVAFLDEVADSQGRTVLRNQILQRNINGFQPGHAPLNITVPMLISKLKREQELTNPDSLNWRKFKDAWKLWVISHIQLNNILHEFDNESDFDENEQCIVPPNSELDRQCFELLLEANRNDQIDQETIRRFYEYGYFNQCDEIEELISQAFTSEKIKWRGQIKELPDQVNKLQREIDDLRTQISNLEAVSELQQVLDQQIVEVQRSFEERISALNFTQSVSGLRRSVKSLNSRLNALENSQTETDSGIDDFVDHIESIIAQIEQQKQNTNQSVTEQLDRMNSVVTEIATKIEQQRQSINQSVSERFSEMDSAISEIRSEVAAQNQSGHIPANVVETAGALRIAHKALRVGESFASKLEEANDYYQNENDYLSDFRYSLNRFGITDSNETTAAIHVALKAFPALEITDSRIYKIWNLICDKHYFYTRIFVEIGWFGLQDCFPKLLAEECFGEQLERINLEASIKKMFEMGDMLWAIHFRNYDRSFPECYLPPFLEWTKDISYSTIKVFLTRTSGNNRCEITEDAYALIARLPEPEEEEPIEAQNLRSSGIIVTQSEWDAWCQAPSDVDQSLRNQFDIVDQLRTTINENGGCIQKTPLQEILHYLRLSQTIEMAPTLALDWALTMRLLPWMEKQPKIIECVLSFLDQEYDDLQHFYKGLQQAYKTINK